MFKETDKLFMLDIETDGLLHGVNNITSICVQEFTLEYIGTCLPIHVAILRTPTEFYRRSNPDTMQWRKENDIDKYEKSLPQKYFRTFLHDMILLMTKLGKTNCHFIANHPEFDFGFLHSYLQDSMLEPFWHYQNIWDLGSLIKGMGVDKNLNRDLLKNSINWSHTLNLHFDGKEQPHNAHYDCVYQIELLRHAYYSRNWNKGE